VKQAQKGDKESFITLIKDSEDMMYRVAKSILKQDDDCADVIQETIIHAYSALGTLKKPAYFKTWLIRILINESRRILKTRSKIVPLTHWVEKGRVVPLLTELDEAIDSLEEEFRVVITLFYLEDFSIEEIAKILQTPQGTIKSRLNRARLKLAKFLKRKEGSFVDGNL
jgi:RNA polymerase sigma-70 factor (ECF subfamily)